MSHKYKGNNQLEKILRKKFSKIKMNIVYRTTNPNSPNFKQYGKVGVRLCSDWKDLDTFTTDGMKLPGFNLEQFLKGNLALDKDYLGNSKIYDKHSCEWVSLTYNNKKKPNQQKYFTVYDTINHKYLGIFYNQSELARKINTFQSNISKALRTTGVYKEYLIKWV